MANAAKYNDYMLFDYGRIEAANLRKEIARAESDSKERDFGAS